MKKFALRLTCRRKYYFLVFVFSLFPNFKLPLSKILTAFDGPYEVYYVTNIFDIHILFFKKICTKMHFVSLFFLNERNITTSFLMIHSKCTVEQYSNLNSNSMNQPCLNYRPSNTLVLLFRFLIILTRLLSKN